MYIVSGLMKMYFIQSKLTSVFLLLIVLVYACTENSTSNYTEDYPEFIEVLYSFDLTGVSKSDTSWFNFDNGKMTILAQDTLWRHLQGEVKSNSDSSEVIFLGSMKRGVSEMQFNIGHMHNGIYEWILIDIRSQDTLQHIVWKTNKRRINDTKDSLFTREIGGGEINAALKY